MKSYFNPDSHANERTYQRMLKHKLRTASGPSSARRATPKAGGPTGGSWHEPPMFDPCIDCLEDGNCPRCGKRSWGDDDDFETPCMHCGWDPMHPDHYPYGDEGPCACLEEQWRREDDEYWASRT